MATLVWYDPMGMPYYKTVPDSEVNNVPLLPGLNIDTGTGQITQASGGTYKSILVTENGSKVAQIWDYSGDSPEHIGDVPLSASSTPASGGGGGGGRSGGGGGGGGTIGKSYSEAFFDWMGRQPTTTELNKMANEGWTEDTIRRYAVTKQGTGPLMVQAINEVRQVSASWYDGDPSGIPASLVLSLISDGLYADKTYLEQTYFPLLRGLHLTDPNAQEYIDAWVEMTGKPLSTDAFNHLNEYIVYYGYGNESQAAWLAWAKTTDAAISGNWGAEHRAVINTDISKLFGRTPTAAELDVGGELWDLNDEARAEYLRATDEYQTIYAGKPAWMDEGEWQDTARAFDSVFQWYYGEHATLNADGSISLPMGDFPDSTPEQKSAYEAWLAEDQRLAALEAEYSEIIGRDRRAATGTKSKPSAGATAHYQELLAEVQAQRAEHTAARPSTADYNGLAAFGMTYINPELLASLLANGVTADELQREFQWTEDAMQYRGIYDEVLTEAYGAGFSDDQWFAFASGAAGSGALKAQLQAAQNRVSYREEFNRLFGYDPDPEDYDRIMNEYVSPAMMVKEVEATNSAEEMYEEVNDLLTRVYGDSVTVDELKDMALGREGTGELKALINQASKLDSFREMHKQYYGQEATPDDYAKYAGYTSASELQWEIVTTEAVAENKEEIRKAWSVAYPDEGMISDEDLFTMYGEQEGYGELRSKVKKAKELYQKAEESEDWAYTYAEHAETPYRAAEQGGIRTAVPSIADL